MSGARLIVAIGSGETTPGMARLHRGVFSRLGPDPVGRLLDTPYGFQENAGTITERIGNYFRDQVGVGVEPVTLRRADAAGPVETEQALLGVRTADWVFAGPGSPSYALRQLAATPLPDALRAKLRDGGALVFASAAACILGRFAVPVYEIYKVGADPAWLDGLDLMAEVGLDVAVLPHYDNAEGGTHDTRFCYLGERRLAAMEDALPEGVGVLGVDEHTAAVLDRDRDTMEVHGRGRVTLRVAGRSAAFPAGVTVPLDRLRATGAAVPAPAGAADHRPDSDVVALESRFDAALAAGDAMAALAAALDVEQALARGTGHEEARRVLRSMLLRLACTAQAGLHDHRRLLAPVVDAVLYARGRAREERDFTLADGLRERLAAAGVDVRDTPDGTTWRYEDPLATP